MTRSRNHPSESRERCAPKPLDQAALEELALAYVARFATSAGRLAAYCRRKLRERGHFGADDGAAPPDVTALVARFVAKGFVDDVGFARTKADALLRRGYGGRRVGETLRADGIDEQTCTAVAPDELAGREAAAAYARRRRFGPFAREPRPDDRRDHEKQLAALLRAGHEARHARHVLAARSITEVEDWIADAAAEENRWL